jgi:phage-related protein
VRGRASLGESAEGFRWSRHFGDRRGFRRHTFRAVYTVRFSDAIYVLHAFQKKSKKGIATPKQDVDLIKRRYAEARELAKYEE